LIHLEINMTRKIALALVVAAAAAGNAFADDITVESNPFVSGRKRAEVQAEVGQYRKTGVNPWSIAYNPLRSAQGGKTRSEVVREYLGSRDEVAAMSSEDSGSAYLQARRSVVSVGPVLAGQPKRAQ